MVIGILPLVLSTKSKQRQARTAARVERISLSIGQPETESWLARLRRPIAVLGGADHVTLCSEQ